MRLPRWPWQRRTDERAQDAWERAEAAKRERAEIQAQWADVLAVTGKAHRHRELNGWTRTIIEAMSGDDR